MRQTKTTTQVARDDKYLKFLMALYLKISKGYTRISISALCVEHKVDSVVVQAVLDLGWVNKMANTMQYYWRGPIPIEAMAEQVQSKITAIKNTKTVNERFKSTPLSATGKPLIPVVKSTEPQKVLKGAIPRYLAFLEALYFLTAEGKTDITISKITAEHKVGSSIPGALIKLNIISKEKDETYKGQGRKVLWSWIGGIPDATMAELVLKTNNAEIVSQSANAKNKVIKIAPGIPERFHHILKKDPSVPEIKVAIIPTPPVVIPAKEWNVKVTPSLSDKEKALKREIALKLLDLGEFERANKMLDELL